MVWRHLKQREVSNEKRTAETYINKILQEVR